MIREVCTADVEPDGMVFDPATTRPLSGVFLFDLEASVIPMTSRSQR